MFLYLHIFPNQSLHKIHLVLHCFFSVINLKINLEGKHLNGKKKNPTEWDKKHSSLSCT